MISSTSRVGAKLRATALYTTNYKLVWASRCYIPFGCSFLFSSQDIMTSLRSCPTCYYTVLPSPASKYPSHRSRTGGNITSPEAPSNTTRKHTTETMISSRRKLVRIDYMFIVRAVRFEPAPRRRSKTIRILTITILRYIPSSPCPAVHYSTYTVCPPTQP